MNKLRFFCSRIFIICRDSNLAIQRMELCFLKTTSGLKISLPVLNDGYSECRKYLDNPKYFTIGSISTFNRHMKLYSSARFHAFNQKSHSPRTYPPHCLSVLPVSYQEFFCSVETMKNTMKTFFPYRQTKKTMASRSNLS